MGSSTIDLGDITGQPSDGRYRSPRRAWWSGPFRRLAGVATAALLLGGTAAADTTAPQPVLTHLGTVPAGDFAVLTGDTLYVHRLPDTRGVALTAYHLGEATTTWEVDEWEVGYADVEQWHRDQGESLFSSLQVHNGVPLVTLRLFGVPAAPRFTTAYDPETGAVRWTREGEPAANGGGVVVLMRDLPSDPSDVWPPRRAVAVDLVTGDEVWTAPAGRWRYDHQRIDRAGHLVGSDDSGRLTAYDVATGTSRSAATDMSGDAGHQVVGDLVLVHGPWHPGGQPPPDSLAVHAYDVETFTHLWTTDLADMPMHIGHCGAVMCVLGSSMTVHGLDPTSGDVRWSVEPTLSDSGPLGDPSAWPWPYRLGGQFPDALVVDDHVVDATTGQPLLPLPPWGQEHHATLRTTAWHLDPVLTWHPPREIGVESRTWFARLHPEPLGLEIVGSTGRVDTCRATNDHVVCRDHDQLHLWSIR